MSAEDFREDVTTALEKAVAGGADPDELTGVLEDMQARVDQITTLREWSG